MRQGAPPYDGLGLVGLLARDGESGGAVVEDKDGSAGLEVEAEVWGLQGGGCLCWEGEGGRKRGTKRKMVNLSIAIGVWNFNVRRKCYGSSVT